MCQKMDTSYTTHISVFTLNYGKMVKETSEHTCTELGVGSLGCGVLSGLDFLAVGCCLDVLWRFLVCELLFVVIYIVTTSNKMLK